MKINAEKEVDDGKSVESKVEERMEEYLEAIYRIQEERSRVARTSDIAKFLNVKPSSVTEMLIKLHEKGYVDYQPYRGAILTKKGEEIAKKIKRYYMVFFKFFHEYLGIDEITASKLSCELEHHLTEEAVEKVCRLIAGECKICEVCNKTVFRLSEVGDGDYRVFASPSKFAAIGIKPGEVVGVRDGKIVVGGKSYELSGDEMKLILVEFI